MAKKKQIKYQEIVSMADEPSLLDLYINKVYNAILLFVPVAGLCSGTVFTLQKLLGWLPDVNIAYMVFFDLICISYLIVALLFLARSYDEKGNPKPNMVRWGKILLGLLIVVHWNLISYIIPGRDFWAYAPFFALLSAFFLDQLLVDLVCAGLNLSIFISWFIKGDELLPVRDEMFNANLMLRVVCIILSLYTVHLITLFGRKYLVSELENIADRDKLTMLLNRRRLNDYMNEFYYDAEEGASDFTIVMIDVDKFKSINDTFGHLFGDRSLKTVAEILSTGIKHDDKAFRWGGDEFMILFKCSARKAEDAMERMCREIESQPLISEGVGTVSLSISYGLAEYRQGISLKDMYDEADKLLYEHKNAKKNGTTA